MALTKRLLNQACRIAEKQLAMSHVLTDAFNERYGVTYSDVDADQIIDALDYGVGTITLAGCDSIMTEAGYPPRREARKQAEEKPVKARPERKS